MFLSTFFAAGLLSGGGIVVVAPVDDVNVGEEFAGGGVVVAPVAASGQVVTKVGAVQRSGLPGGAEIFIAEGSK